MNRYVALAILTQLVVSTVPTASRIVLDHYAVEPYIALRWTISSLIFGGLLLWRGERCDWRPGLLLQVSLLGIVGYVFSGLGTLYAVKVGGVSFFGLLTLMSPLLVVFFSAALLREKIRRRTWLALAFAAIGVTLMVSGKMHLEDGTSPLLAALLVFGAYTCDSLVFLFSKPFRSRMPLLQYMFVAQGAAGIFAWLISAAMIPPGSLLPSGIRVWAAVLFVALVACVGVFYVWYWLLDHLEGQQLGILQYFHGVAAFAWGVVVFREAWTLTMLFGSLALLAAILAAAASRRVS